MKEGRKEEEGPSKRVLFCGGPNLHYNFFSTIDNYFIDYMMLKMRQFSKEVASGSFPFARNKSVHEHNY